MKDGAPDDNTATSEPRAIGDICYDYTNGDVYICVTYTTSTAHTWKKMTP